MSFDPATAPITEPPHVSRPHHVLPRGSCDTHTHVFDPRGRFPTHHQSAYDLPIVPREHHLTVLARMGMTRAVLVQPAPYGLDNAALLDALQFSPERLRGVGVATPETSDAELERMHRHGVRGLRFVEARNLAARQPGAVHFDAIAGLASRIKALGWHVALWAPRDQYIEWLPKLLKLDVPFAIDHLAGIVPALGMDDAHFRNVRSLLTEGRFWLKLSVCRASTQFPGYEELRPLHDALVAANPDRIVWGSDWPYVRMGDAAPDAGVLIDRLFDWIPDAAVRQKMFVDNPARLYDFSAIP